jgi:CheY-like chemotaxis protein/anti-sigma regulatory factor (Ser/Thr protein kinase)
MTIDRTEFNLRSCLEEVSEMMATRVRGDSVQLNCLIPPELPERLLGDPGRIRQMLTNLVGNAVKFTERGEIVVEAHLLQETEEEIRVRVEVRDTGIGIVDTRHGAIFESFTQADGSMTRKYGGTGLGLAITRQLAQLMDGSVGMESEVGAGSCFWFEVRLEKSLEAPSPLRVTQALTILLVDPCATARRALQSRLTHWGSLCLEATDGQSAQALSLRHRPDIILADASCLAEVQTLGVPVVLLTPLVNRPTAEEAQSLAGVLTKPIRLEPLYTLVASGGGHAYVPVAKTIAESVQLGMKILIAEDNAVNAMVLKRLLANWGCEFVSVTTGADVLEEVERHDFDLILMDIQMPEMDGFEATATVRAAGHDLPIIALTAHALHGDRERCMNAGMDDYLSKPIKAAEMLQKLQHWGTVTRAA